MEELKDIIQDGSKIFLAKQEDDCVCFSGILTPDNIGEENANKLIQYFQAWLSNRGK